MRLTEEVEMVQASVDGMRWIGALKLAKTAVKIIPYGSGSILGPVGDALDGSVGGTH